MKHTILGAGGSIGNALAYKLLKEGQEVRLVSRRKFSIPGAEAVKADITKYAETLESIRQSDIVYLCVGLSYDIEIWRESWPKIMKNAIDGCKNVGAKLIFFDNVYMYGKTDGAMTEETPYNPCSKKGELRASIAGLIESEMKQKNISAIIARAADLYGPYATMSSMPYIMVFDKLLKSKSSQWMVNAHQPHSFTYTIDCANSLYMLANNNDTFNQIWHLPTCNPALDGQTFIETAAKEFGLPSKYFVLPKMMVKIAGLFNKTVSELYEMLYQYEFPYYFDSSKFNKRFNYNPKNYIDGIRETIEFIRSK